MNRLVILLIWLLPLLMLIILGENGVRISPFLVGLILLLLFLAAARAIGAGGSRREDEEEKEEAVSDERIRTLVKAVEPFLAVKGLKTAGDVIQFEGSLLCSPPEALEGINRRVAPANLRAILTEGEQNRVRATLVPAVGAEELVAKQPNWSLHGLLLLLTIGTTTWAGAMHQGVNILRDPAKFTVGLPYSIGLLVILGAHELGHYFAARKHRIQVTPPYFIPAPFALGTFGAFISMKGLVQDRRALFDVAVAGPLAGLAFAIPALLFGLRYSQVLNESGASRLLHTGVDVGSSFLMAILSRLALGSAAAEGHRLILHPLAFAGWLGLLLTALNLLPIGQLDGGHIAHALFGSRRSHTLSVIALISLLLLALFVWPGLMMWAFIVFFIAGTRDAPSANDLTPLDPSRQALGYFAFLLLALILVPVPHSLYGTFGIHCPYV